jgi:hypothetical protein
MKNALAILALMVVASMCANAQPAVKNQEFENWKGAQAKSYANDGERKLRLDLEKVNFKIKLNSLSNSIVNFFLKSLKQKTTNMAQQRQSNTNTQWSSIGWS